jgi:SAM-dependent methyltransferase
MPQLAMGNSVVQGAVNHHPTYRNRISLVFATIHVNGIRAGVSHYSQRLVHLLTNKYGKPANDEQDAYDGRFAVESCNESLEYLAIESPNVKWGLPYAPWSPELFEKAIRSLPIRTGEYSFVDLGAGKGLPLLLASKYSFKSITGVEYSKTLADAAWMNVSAHQEQNGSGAPIQCICGDAAEFEFPYEPTVVYLFNPFQGKVMDQVITNIEESLRTVPRDLWVIYANPWEGRKFRRSEVFETIEWNLEYSIHRSTLR